MSGCEAYRSLLSALLDGELEGQERRDVEAHLAECPDCRAYLEDLKEIQAVFRGLDELAPQDFSAHVMERVRVTDQDRPERKTVRLRPWRRWVAAAACCALVAAGAWSLWSGHRQDSGAPMLRSAGPDVTMYSGDPGADNAPEDGGIETFSLENGPSIPMPASNDAADGLEAVEDSAPVEAAYSAVLTTGSAAAADWVEEHLGLTWVPGETYPLTEEEYVSLREALAEAGAEFSEKVSGDGVGYCLAAG